MSYDLNDRLDQLTTEMEKTNKILFREREAARQDRIDLLERQRQVKNLEERVDAYAKELCAEQEECVRQWGRAEGLAKRVGELENKYSRKCGAVEELVGENLRLEEAVKAAHKEYALLRYWLTVIANEDRSAGTLRCWATHALSSVVEPERVGGDSKEKK